MRMRAPAAGILRPVPEETQVPHESWHGGIRHSMMAISRILSPAGIGETREQLVAPHMVLEVSRNKDEALHRRKDGDTSFLAQHVGGRRRSFQEAACGPTGMVRVRKERMSLRVLGVEVRRSLSALLLDSIQSCSTSALP